jgi:alpha-1,3-glucosyltransferase
MAQLVNATTPEALVIGQAYGHNEPLYRAVMRFTLIAIEYLILVPALLKLLPLLYPKHTTTTRRLHLALILFASPLVFIDHGHFQPNSPMHGMVLWATYFLLTQRIELAVVLMVMAVNFK